MDSSLSSTTDPDLVTIVGAGIAGVACAHALQTAGVPFRLLDRGRAPGGRMASPSLHGRRVDIGAGYFTIRDDGFAAVVDDWAATELAREWTDTFGILAPGETPRTTSGPIRWATRDGLRSLVRASLAQLGTEPEQVDVTELPAGHVVLAMPDPQAARLTRVPDAVGYDPVIAVACGFARRDWPFADAAFVHDHASVEFIADDGARRGDGAPVLVVHTSGAEARRHLAEPDGAVAPVLAALGDLGITGTPEWTHAHRWTFAKPAGQHDAAYGLDDVGDRLLGFAGDQWCPSGSPRVESAWRSGTDLGVAIAAQLNQAHPGSA